MPVRNGVEDENDDNDDGDDDDDDDHDAEGLTLATNTPLAPLLQVFVRTRFGRFPTFRFSTSMFLKHFGLEHVFSTFFFF